MIKSEKEFKREMRKIIRRVANGLSPYSSDEPTREELEVVAECVSQGYLLSFTDNSSVMRALDGTPYPDLIDSVVPLKGLSFLKPDRTVLRSKIALWFSFAALLISLLSNLSTIYHNLITVIHYLMH